MEKNSYKNNLPGKYSGMQAYQSSTVNNDLLNKYFSKLQGIIEKPIILKQEFNKKGFHAKNILILTNLTRDNIVLNFDEKKNSIVCVIRNLSIKIFFHWMVSNWVFGTKGDIEMQGVVDKFEIDMGLKCMETKDGYGSKFEVVGSELDINPDDLKVSIGNSFFEMFEPLINRNMFGFTTWMISTVKNQAFKDILIPEIQNFVNSEIKMSAKKSFELAQYNIGLSISPIKDMKVFNKYLMLSLEGTSFSQNKGYEKNYYTVKSEKQISKSKIEELVSSNSLVIIFQEECFMSMLKSLIENKFSHEIILKDKTLDKINLEFMEWDEQEMLCCKDRIETKIGMTVNTSIFGMALSFKVYLICHVTFEPQKTLTNFEFCTDALKTSDKGDKKDQSSSKLIAAWDISLKIVELDNVVFDYGLIKNLIQQDSDVFDQNNENPVKQFLESYLVGQEIKEKVAFPEVNLFGDSTIQKVEQEIVEGFLMLKIKIEI